MCTGVFDQRVFRGLDFVIAEAQKRNIRVILSLVNYWGAYGGMAQYVRWSYDRRGLDLPQDIQPELFYDDPHCQVQ
jgi:endo-1,4-beta-mannosidase